MNNPQWARPTNQIAHLFRDGYRVSICLTAVSTSDERLAEEPGDACPRCRVKHDSEIEPANESDKPKPKRKPKQEPSDE